jgi:signal transduction histidine kinase
VRPRPESTQLARDIEAWLVSPRRRAVLAAAITLLVSAATTVQVASTLQTRGRPFGWFELFAQQLLVWVPWGVIGGPLVYLARWIFRRAGSWPLAALVQVPLSLAVAECVELYETWLSDMVFADAWLAPTRTVSGISFRFTRELLVYWLVLSLGATVYSFLKSQQDERRTAELRLRAEELKSELAASRLDTLRSQLHPHFLFNALHSVGALVRERDDKRALQVLSSLGSLLRVALERSEAQDATLEDELAIVERYLAIEHVRFGERLRYEIDVPSDLRAARVPTLLLLTLVENAVRHGIAPRVEGGRIFVRARARERQLVLEVEDDGPGFEPALLSSLELGPQHVGLANCRRRLSLLYGVQQHIALANNPRGGARVEITLPLDASPRRGTAAYSSADD